MDNNFCNKNIAVKCPDPFEIVGPKFSDYEHMNLETNCEKKGRQIMTYGPCNKRNSGRPLKRWHKLCNIA
jgi:hypothetical protein